MLNPYNTESVAWASLLRTASNLRNEILGSVFPHVPEFEGHPLQSAVSQRSTMSVLVFLVRNMKWVS